MPAPRTLRDLPVIPYLPAACRHLAEFYVAFPRSTPDYLLLLAEACEQMATVGPIEPRGARAVRTLAAELRRRAPEYA